VDVLDVDVVVMARLINHYSSLNVGLWRRDSPVHCWFVTLAPLPWGPSRSKNSRKASTADFLPYRGRHLLRRNDR